MLLVGIEQQREFCMNKQYSEAANMIAETEQLLGFFFRNGKRGGGSAQQDHQYPSDEDYSEIEELRNLKEEWDYLCNELRIQIIEEFDKLTKGTKNEELLHEACFAIEAMGEQAMNDIKMNFCNFILAPYNEIFEPGKPDSDFANSKRRFSWLKRVLKNYDESYRPIFPHHWFMEQIIAKEFSRQTKLHIDEILSLSHLQIDVSILIEVLQATIEFETEIQQKFDQDNLGDLQDFQTSSVRYGRDGRPEIQASSAKEIAMRYKGSQKP
mmetsp:Transcript_1002/g.1801  ORF Transcript_1002/g.1801 Transcript_1002/m.1801 type:complete len:268 (-) Transcript_1002:1305-2108(-)